MTCCSSASSSTASSSPTTDVRLSISSVGSEDLGGSAAKLDNGEAAVLGRERLRLLLTRSFSEVLEGACISPTSSRDAFARFSNARALSVGFFKRAGRLGLVSLSGSGVSSSVDKITVTLFSSLVRTGDELTRRGRSSTSEQRSITCGVAIMGKVRRGIGRLVRGRLRSGIGEGSSSSELVSSMTSDVEMARVA